MECKTTIEIISQCAQIPSFTTYEERILPYIEQFVTGISEAEMILVAENNIIVRMPGDPKKPTIALSAHLDKINHFGKDWINLLSVSMTDEKIIGQLDDAVGIGLCLSILQQSAKAAFPPLLLLFSEMEEGYGLKHHPEWLRNNGQGIHSGLGAERISTFLIDNNMLPDLVITIDTTPLFKGDSGLAIYTDHWEKNGLVPTPELESATDKIYQEFVAIDPELMKSNNTNDYLTYGKMLNQGNNQPIPSIALEPAIFPYHQQGEKIFLKDIERLEKCLLGYLESV